MPYFQNDDFALFDGQSRQVTHCFLFGGAFIGGPLKPAPRFQFPRHAPPQGTAIVQRAIPKRAHTVMLQLRRRLGLLHQSDEGFVQDVLGLRMAQAQRAPVKDQFRGLRFIEPLAPMW